ncbi:MAG: transcriptional repressor LexA [Treponema sp.]|jgi:repressor LexA|nr:transcriptional repressor LexA [Treponema sp.]
MKELTRRQIEVLSFIAEYSGVHAYPPTIREIADYFSVSVKAAHDHVSALKKKGRVKQADRRSRTMELVRGGEDEKIEEFVQIPILGNVPAGQPVLTEDNWNGYISLSRSMLKRKQNLFMVNVRGDSMSGAGVMDGDLAIVEKLESPDNGEIVVAVVNEAITLKRFFRESNRIRLQPENPAYMPIYSQNVRVLGRLALIIRSY